MPAATKTEPQQHKQPSRKGKKAWRKNVDITSVQQGLESLRDEIRLGGPLAEKPAEDIFVVDIAPSEDIKKKHKIQKQLKVDQILAERSAVPAVDNRKRMQSKIGDGIYEPSSKRQRKDWVSKKEVQRLKRDINKTSLLDPDQNEATALTDFDLWEQKPAEPTTLTKADEYIPKPQAKVAPQSIRRAPTTLTATGKPIKAIPNPNAGTSYNPSFEAWDNLITAEGAKEVSAEESRLLASEAAEEREARIAAIAASQDRDQNQSDYESAWEGFETENEDDMLKKKRPQRKNPMQLKKAKRRQKEEQLARHTKASADRGRRDHEAFMALLKQNLTQDISTPDTPEVQIESSDDGQDQPLRRRKLGPAAIPEKNLEIVLPDELQESLRRLRPEGNLLGDRFRNLLVNGKIESRKPIPPARKKKVKMTEKWSYKDFEIQV